MLTAHFLSGLVKSKDMDRKMICVVFMMLVVASMVEAASPPTRINRWGKRDSKVC